MPNSPPHLTHGPLLTLPSSLHNIVTRRAYGEVKSSSELGVRNVRGRWIIWWVRGSDKPSGFFQQTSSGSYIPFPKRSMVSQVVQAGRCQILTSTRLPTRCQTLDVCQRA